MVAMIGLRRTTASALIAVMLVSIAAPGAVCAGAPADDLKQIEYKYYFRGKYQQAIESLQTFLARVDLTPADSTRAREFLAASYVLGGAPAMGKDVFLQMLANNPAYGGPDPTVFQLDVMNSYGEARTEHAAMVIMNAPPSGEPALASPLEAGPASATEKAGKPIYKQWWLYAGAAAVLLVAGVAAGGKDEGNGNPTTSGGVTVGVTIR